MKSLISKRTFIFLIMCFACSVKAQNINQKNQATNYVLSQSAAETIVKKVLRSSPIIDGHNDLYIHFVGCKDCPKDLADYPIDIKTKGQTDIPRWRKGGVGGQLLNIASKEPKAEKYLESWDLLYRLQSAYPRDIQIVGTAENTRRAMREGKIAIIPSLEGAVILENNLALLRNYYRLGLRSVTFAYETNDLADGSDDEPKHNGISSFGKEMVKEMNRLGIMIDMSHISAKAMRDILDVSQAPVIFSHSNTRTLCNVNRNVSDDVLQKLKKNRGIIMLTFVPYFTTNEFSKWMKAGDVFYYDLKKKYIDDKTKVNAEMKKWEQENLQHKVTISDIADHFDYVKSLIGVDYIGIGGDFDGIDYTITELEDVSTYPKLLVELARRGWTGKELRKITGENFLRVFNEVEKKSVLLQKSSSPSLSKFPDKK